MRTIGPGSENDSTAEHDSHFREEGLYTARFRAPAREDSCYLCWRSIYDYAEAAALWQHPTESAAADLFYALMERGAPLALARELSTSDVEWVAEPTQAEYRSVQTREAALAALDELYEARSQAEATLSRFAADLAALGDSEAAMYSAVTGVLRQAYHPEHGDASGVEVREVVQASKSLRDSGHSSERIQWRAM